jgi:hypothetical protein
VADRAMNARIEAWQQRGGDSCATSNLPDGSSIEGLNRVVTSSNSRSSRFVPLQQRISFSPPMK